MQGRWRAEGGALWSLAAILLFLMFPAGIARADCGTELTALKAKLPAVADAKRRQEAKLLLDKAAIEQEHARAGLCEAALASASKLMN